jgi:hypothetical protein
MKSTAKKIEGSAQTVEEFRNRLSEATRKWRESAMMLCEVRKEVAHYLILKRISDRDLRRARRKRRSGSHEAKEQMERFQAETRGLSFEGLRRIFVKVDHLINLPAAKDRAAETCILLPSFDAAPCQACGLPLPQGRKKFCSEGCRKERAAKGNQEAGRDPAGSASAGAGATDEPNPLPGIGDRNLDCDFYEACLDLAILEEWDSFQCSLCRLKGPQEQLALGSLHRMTG